MPGDDLVPRPLRKATRAITIDAPRPKSGPGSRRWLWQGRCGWNPSEREASASPGHTGPVPPARPAIVTLPAEIDMASAGEAGEHLARAFTPGVRVVIADMTTTTFCDPAGIDMLLRASRRAAAHGAELRLAVPCPRRVKRPEMLGVDAVLPICLSLQAALTGSRYAAALCCALPGRRCCWSCSSPR